MAHVLASTKRLVTVTLVLLIAESVTRLPVAGCGRTEAILPRAKPEHGLVELHPHLPTFFTLYKFIMVLA